MSNKIIAEYIWIGGNGELRSKARTLRLDIYNKLPNPLPEWNYNGNATGQASNVDSEVILKPCSVYRCPFRKNNNILIMCDTYKCNGLPLPGNNRNWAKSQFDQDLSSEPWFAFEQEFFIVDFLTGKPFGFPKNGDPKSQGQYYCGVGSQNSFARIFMDAFYEFCLYATLNISGINSEVAPAQWEYQIGPVEGINAGDQLYISRYILIKLAEKFDLVIDFRAKPLKGDWNGSGCHTNYSTKCMREGTTFIS